MPVLAGWLTGEQVPQEVIEQTLTAMGEVLASHGGEAARTIQPGAGLIAFADTAYAMQQQKEAAVLDWVPERRTLVYRRPLSGLHPLYYIENWPAEGNLLFASEIKALLALGAPRRLHIAALHALTRYGTIPAPWTAFKDIHIVPAGSILRWQHTNVVLSPSSDFVMETPDSAAQNLERLEGLLSSSCQAMLPSHDQLVALVGGDRAALLIAALAAQSKQQAFPLATLGANQPFATSAWHNIQTTSDRYQLPLLEVTGVDQPEFWQATILGLEAPCRDSRPLAIHQLLHTVSTETGARVVLSGLGSQTLMGLTSKRLPVALAQTSNRLAAQRQLTQPDLTQTLQNIWSSDAKQLLQSSEAWEETLHARKLQRRAQQYTDDDLGMHYLDLHLNLADLLVHPFYQLALQEQMLIRSPYLHPPIMETLIGLARPLQDDLSYRKKIAEMINRYIPGLSEVPAKLPLTLPTSSLHGGGPEANELLEQVLSPVIIQNIGLFDSTAVQTLQKSMQDDQASEQALIFIFTTQLFCMLFGIEEWV
ncbi:hypothetical protein KDA_08270 [Dictyobacter alpinus]|uniref:asparagine synthase (glutamine-hydrolyzing) n=1 Tax=Dictyobacter alpinus TaxID=2014873 RepID=A0A402B1X1_9CHLR|nr:asparagine synthase-related protein [Dictyobacter alpinus]GCE25343.1 hypothetical protein KDA_08270 [Dictyobacter alpinus]